MTVFTKFNKTYDYKDDKTNASLNFTLNMMDKKELSSFRDLLKNALSDITEDIEKL